MQSLVDQHGHSDRFQIDSAGTASYHIGRPPDARMIAAGTRRGLQFNSVAQAFQKVHADQRNWILAMDRENLRDIMRIAGLESARHICLLSDLLDNSWPRDVPDPYYGGDDGFEYVLDMLYAACPRLLDRILTQTKP
jgi:protein-tyrosine phosphatase